MSPRPSFRAGLPLPFFHHPPSQFLPRRHIRRSQPLGWRILPHQDNCKMHKIDWHEVGLQIPDIATNNVGENDLNPRIKYIMVRFDNLDRTLVQEGW